VSTILASTAICTGITAVKNLVSGNNNFQIGTEFNVGIGNGLVEVSSNIDNAVLPKKG
jgi:hypothetical protein